MSGGAFGLALLATLLLSAQSGLADEGQYRSRILLDPGDSLGSGAQLSIEQLEQQIDSIAQPYAQASAGRHLARYYLQQGEYEKAVAYYQRALAADGLSAIANREMLRELARVYLLQHDSSAAIAALQRVLALKLPADAADDLLLARTYYEQSDYLQVVSTLDAMAARGATVEPAQMRQAVALYYRAGAWQQCEALLQQLLALDADDVAVWRQLVSVYLQQNKKQQALNQLALAYDKKVPLGERDLRLLSDLYAANGDPYRAATLMAEAVDAGTLAGDGEQYRKLFEYWLQAHERERAAAALDRAARLTGDTELYLYLAQLQMEQEDWHAMFQTVVAACTSQLTDQYVSRANLLLGISQLKLDDRTGARRSLINATLIGGASVKATQWLRYMAAAPTTEDEARRIVGPCYGSRGKQVAVILPQSPGETGERVQPTGTVTETGIAAPGERDAESVAGGKGAGAAQQHQHGQHSVSIKTVPAFNLFYSGHEQPLAQLVNKIQPLAMRMGVALVKSGGAVDGPLQLIWPESAQGSSAAPWQLALPARGSPRAGRKYKIRRAPALRCAYRLFEGEAADLSSAWSQFVEDVQLAGYQTSGERRLVLTGRATGSTSLKAELQLGIGE